MIRRPRAVSRNSTRSEVGWPHAAPESLVAQATRRASQVIQPAPTLAPRMRRAARAFSLVEILIVVMIIGILAAIAVPKLANASQVARESSLKDNLRILRTALGVYKSQHSLYPGYPGGNSAQTPTAQATQDQLLLYTDANGNTSASGSAIYNWGPYLNQMPLNPVNNSAAITILSPTDAFTPDGTTGWLYQPATGMIKANCAGNDTTDHPIIDY